MSQKKLAIGVDLGGTKLDVGLIDASGNILKRSQKPTDVPGGPAAVTKQIVAAVQELQKGMAISCVGVGLAGQIEPESGVVHFAPNLQWHHVPLKQQLSDALKLPVFVLNDVRAATWGEWHYGAGKGCQDLICLFIGTGIGGGIVSGGNLLTGARNTAGEVGHMTINWNGPPCTCGSNGCMEAYAGGWAIAKRAQEKIASDSSSGRMILELSNGKRDLVTAKEVLQAYHKGDPLAVEVINEAIRALVVGTANLVNAFGPSKILLGGGILKGLPELKKHLQKGVCERAFKAACASLEIRDAHLISDAGVVGAATYAMKGLT